VNEDTLASVSTNCTLILYISASLPRWPLCRSGWWSS